MLQLTTKWMNNTIAKKALQSGDFIECANNLRLYIVGFGELTKSAKNTYNYQVKDEQGTILASGENAYLDKLTTLIKGESPKTKERKESKSESAKASKPKTNESKESLLLTFDEAFDKACKQVEEYKPIALELDKYDTKDTIKLTMIILKDAKLKEEQRIKNEAKKDALQALRKTLEIAKVSGNVELISSIEAMIKDKENE